MVLLIVNTNCIDMKPTAIEAKNGEWYGVVTHYRKELYRTATTSLDKVRAIQRAQKWIREQDNEPDPKKRKQKRDNAKKRLKKIKETINVDDVVSTPKGTGVVKRISSYGIIEVKFSNGVQQSFMKEQVEPN
jgi:hypothetical protein